MPVFLNQKAHHFKSYFYFHQIAVANWTIKKRIMKYIKAEQSAPWKQKLPPHKNWKFCGGTIQIRTEDLFDVNEALWPAEL